MSFKLAFLLALVATASAFPNGGAPVCSYADTTSAQMTNVHGNGMAPQASVTVTPNGQSYTVALTGIKQCNGLIMWVRDAAGTSHVGTWDIAALTAQGFKGKDCTAMSGSSSGVNSTFGHANPNAKMPLSFQWTPDQGVAPGMAVVAEAVVVLQNKAQWFNANGAMFISGAMPAAAAAAPASSAAAAVATTVAAAPASTVAAAPASTVAAVPASTMAAAAVPVSTMAAAAASAAASVTKTATVAAAAATVTATKTKKKKTIEDLEAEIEALLKGDRKVRRSYRRRNVE